MTLQSKRFLHCWKGFQDEDGLKQFTCLLQSGHKGNCSPTPDEDVSVEFSN